MSRPRRLLALAPALLALGLGPCLEERHPGVLIRLDPTATHQGIDGLGGSAANESELRGMPEPDRGAVMDLVFGDLAPSVVRIKPRPAIEPSNDNDDPAVVDPQGFDPPEDHLWQLAQIAARGSPRLVAALWTPPAWMKGNGSEVQGSLVQGMEPELAEFFSVYLGYLEDAGHVLDALSIQNEPEAASPWDSCYYTPARYAAAAEAVAQRLAADGHSVPLSAPDNAIASFVPIYLAALLAKPTAGPATGAVAFHHYQYGYYDAAAIADSTATLAAQGPPGLPLWMTEFSNTTGVGYGTWDEAIAQAELVHATLVNGASLYVMWNLYRPGGPGEALVVIPTTPGVPGYTVTPKYWTFRQYTRWVRPGAVRIGATSGDDEVLASAYRDAAAGTITAVLINRRHEARWALADGARLGPALRVVRSSALEQGVELPPDSPHRFGERTVLLPPRSVTTVVWEDGDVH
jgi:glucosylceramidase